MVPIEKNPNATDCGDFRKIRLISHASKIMLSILKKRLNTKAEEYLGEDQYGFRKGCGTREAIAVMNILSECNPEHNQNVYVCFVDFEKAFDRIRWDKLLEILKNIGIDWRDKKLLSELCMGQTAVVRTDDGETTPIVIGRRTWQGCPLSPLLFNIYDEAIVREAFDDIKEGVKIGGNLIKEIKFADDKCVIASTEKGLQEANIKSR